MKKISDATKNIVLPKIKKFFSTFCYISCQTFDYTGKIFSRLGISANMITLVGLGVGLLAMNFVAMQMYMTALVLILLNRFLDGLDGAVARINKITNFGIFFDAVCDYIFYSSVIFGFALANPGENAVCASFLLFSFTASAVVMLGFATIANKKSKQSYMALNKSPLYLWGFAQGAETFLAIVLLCLLPSKFMVISIFFGVLTLIKAVGIIVNAYYVFEILEKAGKDER